MTNHNEPVAWRWDQAMKEGDWQTGFTEHGEPQPSPTVRNVTPLFARPPQAGDENALSRALEFIESLTADPLLMGVDDIEMTLDDVQAHARIELASIRSILERSSDYYRRWLANKGSEEAVPLHPSAPIEEQKLTPEQHRHAQFMGGIGDEEWD